MGKKQIEDLDTVRLAVQITEHGTYTGDGTFAGISQKSMDVWNNSLASMQPDLFEGQEQLDTVKKIKKTERTQFIDSTLGLLYWKLNPLNKSTIKRPPAHGLLSVLEFTFTKKTFEHIFKQTIDDLRDEHYQYLQQNKKWRARMSRLRIYPIVIFTCISLLGTKFIKQFIAVLK